MIKVSNLCALICFNLVVFCLSKGEVLQSNDGFLVPSEDGSDEQQCSCWEKCDFESDLCSMINSGKLLTGWIRRNGMNITGSPLSDHNGNNTAYFLTLSSELVPYPAVVRSRVLFVAGNQLTCQVSFYYWMGELNGTLTVGLQTCSNSTLKTIWQEREGIRSQWQKAVITINNTLNDAEVVFQGRIFEPWTPGETIAIDDISVSKGCFLTSVDKTSLCKERSHACNETHIPDQELCSNASKISSSAPNRGFCLQQVGNFKIQVCDWNSNISEHVSWMLMKELHEPDFKSVLLKDRSNDTNDCCKWVQDNDNTKSALYKIMSLNGSMCYCFGEKCNFSFSYFLRDSSVLKAVLYTNQDEQLVLWKASVPTNNDWVKVEIQIPTGSEKIKLLLEGAVESKTSSVCLDNYHFVDKAISELPSIHSPEEFACASGQHIDNNLVCDYHLDCLDGSDENPAACANYTLCDFEYDLCDWKTLSTKDIPWNRMKGQDSSDSGLPTRDHTTNSGKGTFVYVAGSPEAKTKLVVSHFSSPVFTKLSSDVVFCQMRFWYQLSQDSQLNVFIKAPVDGDLRNLYKQKLSKNTMQWTKANILITNTTGKVTGPFQIIIQATIQSTKGFVAVDDISLTKACETNYTALSSISEDGEAKLEASGSSFLYCPPGSLPCEDGNCVSSDKFCDFTPDCPDGSDEAMCPAKCDFETDSCGWWEAAGADAFDWIRSSRSGLLPAFQKQAPPRDHTYNQSEGHFMFIWRNSSNILQIAQLQSPKFRQAGSGCTMTFWYYNYGLSVGAAQMQLLVDGVKYPTVLWRIYYNQGDQWLKAFIQLGRVPQPFQLSLDKVSLGFYDGVAAIDDITFENCALPPPTLNCEGPGRFWCRDSKACIDRLLLCDLVDDCGDGSDEGNCAPELQCNFELGLCNWEQDVDDNFNWTRKQGPTSKLNAGPLKDHTLGTAKGHYLYIDSSEPQMFQDRAALLSPIFNSTSAQGNKSCIFRFHYHMFGKHIYRLAVSQRTVSNTRGHLLWHTFGNQGDRWIRKILYIRSSEPFQILVEGTVGDGFTGDIGIDDLSFMDCVLYSGSLPADSTTPSGTSIPVTLPMNNCTEKEFICRATGQCINITQRCDFRPDCSDKSDESSCVSVVCDFDDGSLCEWHQPAFQVETAASVHTANMFQWGLGRGASIHPGEENHRPLVDQTMATKEGWYLYADSSNGAFGHTADLSTPVISQTGPKCKLVFWNYMNGATVGSLKVLSKMGNTTSELWAQSGPQGPQWNRAEVFLGVRSYFQVLFKAKRGISYVGDVAVDDVSFEDCSPLLIPHKHCTSAEFTCANKYCIPKDNLCDFVNDCADNSDESQNICSMSIGRCDFEFDLCDWKQDQNDDFDWNLRTGGIPKAGMGPIADHTLQEPSGHYIFIKSSFPQLPGQVARISSVAINRRSKNCKIIFYYHMYGVKIGSLTVYQVTVSNPPQVIFSLSEDQGNFWKRKELLLDASEDFWITFEGRVGPVHWRYIALDDIVFSKECLPSSALLDKPTELPSTGSCSQGYLECLNGKCYRPEQSCNFEDDCGDMTDERECGTSCTFENDLCGWQNSLADNFDWVMGTGSLQSLRPSKDHTLGSGKGQFLYLEATSTGVKGEKAHLKSSRWKESSTTCTLSFWYYISSKATGHIQVLIKTDSSLLKMWSHSGENENDGGQWRRAEILLGKLRNFEVIFEGIRAKYLGGGAAIDDIEYKNCSTIGEDSGVCPTVTDFVCWNKKCIEFHLVCDYKADCGDWSDEADCSQYTTIPGSCNFETQGQDWTAVCGLTQDSDDEFDWRIGNRAVIEQGGPDSDHTPGNGRNFLYVNSSAQQEWDKARIVTARYFPASQGICRLRFWFWTCNSPQIGVLKVYTVEEFGMDILMWSATGNKSSAWTYANVILSTSSPFKVAFEAVAGANELIEFAIDDISFTPECAFGGPVSPQPPTCGSDKFTCIYTKQCVPFFAKCNGVDDCEDGTDEMACPTVKPTTDSPRLCKETEFQCDNQSCIPSLLRCDGVADCRFNEDEDDCPIKDCFNGSLLCPSTNSCIPVSQRCDGIVDCIDFAPDESSCSECPMAYCKNGGTCKKEVVPICQCRKEWRGNRCHLKANPSLMPSSGSLQNDTWTVLGAGLAFLLIEIAVAISCILSKRKLPRIFLTVMTSWPIPLPTLCMAQPQLYMAQRQEIRKRCEMSLKMGIKQDRYFMQLHLA
ncbi:MAM and LDL-receptor class A domain-containing protein 1 isoform X3 [Hemicordylus capensis]|uniref:MAM and LDL-receptor class A domain-containing protein 1 isoform X3 n=1 Tax=Hemicordylus capensis TaxID=884348 RepID=UPI00230367B6|nr:MAM and LDL-receptor class A domain-containing protein 1 isoform X3 [Hemicordylus capensis]